VKVECAMRGCVHNRPFNKDYGHCEADKDIVLKWRLAADFGRGNIVMMECLNLELKQEVA